MRDSAGVVLHFKSDVRRLLQGITAGQVLRGGDLLSEMDGNAAGFSVECVPCVGDEVEHDLMDLVFVDANGREFGLGRDGELDRAWDGRFDEVQGFSNRGFRVADGTVLRNAVGVAEHLVGEFAAPAGSFDDVGVTVRVSGLGGEAAKFGVADNPAQDVVDVVNDTAAEHADVPEAIGMHDLMTVAFNFCSKIEDLGAESSDEGFEVAEIEGLRGFEGDVMRGEREEVGELDEERILIAVGCDDAGGSGVAERDFVGDVREDRGENRDGDVRAGFAEGAEQGDCVGVGQDIGAENRVGRGGGDAEKRRGAGVLSGDGVSEVLHGFGDAV